MPPQADFSRITDAVLAACLVNFRALLNLHNRTSNLLFTVLRFFIIELFWVNKTLLLIGLNFQGDYTAIYRKNSDGE